MSSLVQVFTRVVVCKKQAFLPWPGPDGGTYPGLGYPVLGYPWDGTWDQSLGYPHGMELGPVTGVPQKGHGTSGSIMGWRWGTPGVNRQTPVKTNFPSYYAHGR